MWKPASLTCVLYVHRGLPEQRRIRALEACLLNVCSVDALGLELLDGKELWARQKKRALPAKLRVLLCRACLTLVERFEVIDLDVLFQLGSSHCERSKQGRPNSGQQGPTYKGPSPHALAAVQGAPCIGCTEQNRIRRKVRAKACFSLLCSRCVWAPQLYALLPNITNMNKYAGLLRQGSPVHASSQGSALTRAAGLILVRILIRIRQRKRVSKSLTRSKVPALLNSNTCVGSRHRKTAPQERGSFGKGKIRRSTIHALK